MQVGGEIPWHKSGKYTARCLTNGEPSRLVSGVVLLPDLLLRQLLVLDLQVLRVRNQV